MEPDQSFAVIVIGREKAIDHEDIFK